MVGCSLPSSPTTLPFALSPPRLHPWTIELPEAPKPGLSYTTTPSDPLSLSGALWLHGFGLHSRDESVMKILQSPSTPQGQIPKALLLNPSSSLKPGQAELWLVSLTRIRSWLYLIVPRRPGLLPTGFHRRSQSRRPSAADCVTLKPVQRYIPSSLSKQDTRPNTAQPSLLSIFLESPVRSPYVAQLSDRVYRTPPAASLHETK
ncbi:hypothetical protein B0H10DRAFT_2443264 [Mycena sp. CBHHK59/15]|nr:hypothetical protein B0H10DRAFT_2443264 [Mycena sp. CBHHK59/15]